jgi:uncharacterized membrane protein YqiK
MANLLPVIALVFIALVLLVMIPVFTLGLVIIGENQVGMVVKKFALNGKKLTAGKLIALNAEPGYQADTLAPGWYFGYFPWMYSVQKVPLTVVPQGEIALVVALDGSSIPPARILGKIVKADNFQNARAFLTEGGEKGRQPGILTAGVYRINTALFTVITSNNAVKHSMLPEQLKVYRVEQDKVGIVTTLDGRSIDKGEMAALYLPGHDNFQNAQKFIEMGGQRGLQEQIVLSGSWNLNPWFVSIEQVPMTEVPIGYVGVVISYIGKAHQDTSGEDFKHGDLVNQGHKGVWQTPLYPGKHPVNPRVMKVEPVPTTNIVLNWASRTEAHNYDNRLNSITVRSRDGFGFDLDVAQIIHVGALDAPRVISRVGSVQNLVDHVLQPIVGNYFRNAAQHNTVLDFLIARSERQREAAEHIRGALAMYDVQAIDTLIGNINPPAELMVTLTDRKIAEEQQKTYEVQQAAQTQRQQLVRETAIADIQQDVVKAERGVSIAELAAKAQIQQATGDAESIRLRAQGESEGIRMRGQAQAEAYQAGAQAIGDRGYTAVQLMQIIGDKGIRIIPELAVNGGGEKGGGIVDALLAVILQNQLAGQPKPTNGTGGTLTPKPQAQPRAVTDTQSQKPVVKPIVERITPVIPPNLPE